MDEHLMIIQYLQSRDGWCDHVASAAAWKMK